MVLSLPEALASATETCLLFIQQRRNISLGDVKTVSFEKIVAFHYVESEMKNLFAYLLNLQYGLSAQVFEKLKIKKPLAA